MGAREYDRYWLARQREQMDETARTSKTPNTVTRDALPPAEKELTLYADDSPARPGHTPAIGDQDWTIKIPLHDGTRLNLHLGRETWENFVGMVAAYMADEAEEQLRP